MQLGSGVTGGGKSPLDTSAGLENEVIFLFPCLQFLIYPVAATYHPLPRDAWKPLNVISSSLGKSWLCTLIGVGPLQMGNSPGTSLRPVRGFELRSAFGTETVYLDADNVLEWLNE